MRTARAPTTALSGKNISEDSLAISTAILAAPYAVLQADSWDDPSPSEPVSEGSQDAEPIDEAMELDEATSAFGLLVLEWVRTTSFFLNSIGNVGTGGTGLSVGVADGEAFRRKRGMVDGRTTKCRRRLT